VTLADHGAGKSYLGFILYDLYFKAQGGPHLRHRNPRPLVEASQKLAADLGFERMEFLNMSVAESTQADFMPERFDVVTALHACDTATDDAIAFGLEKKAKAMVLVPCCQAEVAACLRQTKALSLARTPLAELWRHPIHTRDRQPDHQCAALPVPGSQRLPGDGDRAGGLGAQHEERADRGPLHRPQETRGGRSPAAAAGRVRTGSIGAEPFQAAATRGSAGRTG
jgi:hypothetical protein